MTNRIEYDKDFAIEGGYPETAIKIETKTYELKEGEIDG